MSAWDHIIARAPNHLGDGVMALPALRALSRLSVDFEIQAPAWGRELYHDIDAKIVGRGLMDEAELAVLFAPSFHVAWEARRVPRRIGVAGDWRRFLLTDVVPAGAHQADTYSALARRAGAIVDGDPVYVPEVDDGPVTAPIGHVGLNPISKAGAVREWQGFSQLAGRLKSPVVFYGGPSEERRVAVHGSGYPMLVGLTLDAFARNLRRCSLFISNDSGAAHFARACGVPTLVIYGSTTALRTGPSGAVGIEGPDLSCRPCYKGRCRFELQCLDISVDSVLAAVAKELQDA